MEINAEKLLTLITQGESETIEFKESFGDETLETIGSFSNARGGIIFLGVKDSGEICGFKLGNNNLEEIANKIQATTDPRLQPSISTCQVGDKHVIVIKVRLRTGAPISVRGRYFRRVGRTNQRMSHEEIMQEMISSSGQSWDAFLETGAGLDHLDANLINLFIQNVRKVGRRPVPEQVTGHEYLRKFGLIQDSTPTRAALLLFGKDPEHFFSSAFLKIGRFRTPIHIVDDREAHGPLLTQLDLAMGWFRDRLTTEFGFIGKVQREVYWEYPLNAIREAIINVLCHRDYASAAHSQIRLYDNQLEIWNPGALPPSLTPELLLSEHDSIPRNRKIAEAFFHMGLIERWGSGTIRIASELQSSGHPIPKFESAMERFNVVFYKQIPKMEFAVEGLSKRQLLAMEYIRKHGSISNAEFQEISGMSRRTCLRELNDLKSNNILIIKQEQGRSVKYYLNNDPS